MNWPEVVAYLQSCPPARAKEQLLRLAMGKCRVKPVRARIRLPRGQKAKASIPKLKKELDRVFSIFIRCRGANDVGIGYCKTCGRTDHWTNMDCGHYQPRQDMATRWDEKNCHLQCKSCNGFRGGEPEKMAAHIDLKYGEGTAASLRAQARQPFKLNRQWLEAKIAHYKNLIGEAPNPSNISSSSPTQPPATAGKD